MFTVAAIHLSHVSMKKPEPMMGLGIFFTVVVGGGLMILIFYSSRAGYDEAPQIEYDEESDQEPKARRQKKRQRKKVTRTHA
jgi:hypothetical protein